MEDAMRKSAIALAALGLLSAVTAVAPATAEAHPWHRGWRGGDWGEHYNHDRGPAIALGVIGGILAGAAIASAPAYAPPPAYYYPPTYYYGAPYGYPGYGYYQ
jgi:hypothetical protein